MSKNNWRLYLLNSFDSLEEAKLYARADAHLIVTDGDDFFSADRLDFACIQQLEYLHCQYGFQIADERRRTWRSDERPVAAEEGAVTQEEV
jgi:hypothetical protein